MRESCNRDDRVSDQVDPLDIGAEYPACSALVWDVHQLPAELPSVTTSQPTRLDFQGDIRHLNRGFSWRNGMMWMDFCRWLQGLLALSLVLIRYA